jgi:hypothetical protein
MTELKALGLVDSEPVGESDNSPKQITLKPDFDWFLDNEFKQLREGFKPAGVKDIHRQEDCRTRKEKSPLSEAEIRLWEKFAELQSESIDGVNREQLRRGALIPNGIDAGAAFQIIEDTVNSGYMEDRTEPFTLQAKARTE